MHARHRCIHQAPAPLSPGRLGLRGARAQAPVKEKSVASEQQRATGSETCFMNCKRSNSGAAGRASTVVRISRLHRSDGIDYYRAIVPATARDNACHAPFASRRGPSATPMPGTAPFIRCVGISLGNVDHFVDGLRHLLSLTSHV